MYDVAVRLWGNVLLLTEQRLNGWAKLGSYGTPCRGKIHKVYK